MSHFVGGNFLYATRVAVITRSERVEFNVTIGYLMKAGAIHHACVAVPLKPSFRQNILAGSGRRREEAKAVTEVRYGNSRSTRAGCCRAAVYDAQGAAGYRRPGRHRRIHVRLES